MNDDKTSVKRRNTITIIFLVIAFIIHILLSPFVKLAGWVWGMAIDLFCNRLYKKASHYMNKHDYRKAIKYTKRIISIIPAYLQKNNEYYLEAIPNLGHLYSLTKDYEKAEKYLELGLEITEPDTVYRGLVHYYLANFYEDFEKLKLAEEHYLKALEYYSKYEKSINYETLTYNLSKLYKYMGQDDKANDFQIKTKEAHSPDLATVENTAIDLKDAASDFFNKNKLSEAEAKINDAILLLQKNKIKTEVYAAVLVEACNIALKQKKTDESIAFANKAINIFENVYSPEAQDIYFCKSYIGTAHINQRKYEKAETILAEALAGIRKTCGRESINYLTCLHNIAREYIRMGYLLKVEKYLIDIMEIYLAVIEDNYETMDVNERIAFIKHRFNFVSTIYNYLAREEKVSPLFIRKVFQFRLNMKWTFMGQPDQLNQSNANFFKIKNSLTIDDAVIEILSFNEKDTDDNATGKAIYLFFIVTAENVEAPTLIVMRNGIELNQDFSRLYSENLKRKSIDFLSYGHYWQKVDYLVRDKKRLYVSPDGIYNDININTFFTENGKYIFEEKEIRLCQDLRLLPERRERIYNFPKSALIMANPKFHEDENRIKNFLPPLPVSEDEAASVSSILSKEGWQVKKYIRAQVTKDKFFNIKNVGLLHIATHGQFEEIELPESIDIDKLMLGSYLFLSDSITVSSKDNTSPIKPEGCLFSKDILKMDLRNTELVVLSACLSGVANDVYAGESVGFQRTFFLAGAKTLIITLWQVLDIITAEFMISFYSNWVKSGDKYLSFRIAQQEIKKKYKYPFYWGGFIMVDR